MSAVRKIPMRKCVGCSERKTKQELIRVVRTPEGEFLLDESGRRNGRGAYLCRCTACLEKARKNRGLARSFGTAIPEEVYEALEKEMKEIEAQ